MPRFFLELSYKGTAYSGFQVQKNAVSIQSEVEKVLQIFYKQPFHLTCSSRTDAGVHALQNFFHFDIDDDVAINNSHLYNLNAMLPADIVLKNFHQVANNAHCRFDALSREYHYVIYNSKNPFLAYRAWFFPYKVNIDLLNQAAAAIKLYTNFTSFAKRNTQVKTFNCTILNAHWNIEDDCLVFHITANRFLRGMVRGLVATMLKVGRQQITMNEFHEIIKQQDCTKADFSSPAQGLFLYSVQYAYLKQTDKKYTPF